MNALFGQDLPAPRSGELSLYLLGPGIGESVVAIMPDLRAVVVDVCECDGANLTLELLGVLGVEQVDLLAISHPDLDHVRGLSVLLDKKPPRELWRYPGESSARDFALAWAKRRRETPLANALRALGSFLSRSEGETFFASYGDRVWPHPPTDYRVHSLAPTTYDQDRALRAWNRRLSAIEWRSTSGWTTLSLAGDRSVMHQTSSHSLSQLRSARGESCWAVTSFGGRAHRGRGGRALCDYWRSTDAVICCRRLRRSRWLTTDRLGRSTRTCGSNMHSAPRMGNRSLSSRRSRRQAFLINPLSQGCFRTREHLLSRMVGTTARLNSRRPAGVLFLRHTLSG